MQGQKCMDLMSTLSSSRDNTFSPVSMLDRKTKCNGEVKDKEKEKRLQLFPNLQDLAPGSAGILEVLQCGVEGGVGSRCPTQSLHDMGL